MRSRNGPDWKIVNHYKCIKPDNRSSRLVGLAAVLPSRVLQSIGHRDCPQVAVMESGSNDLFRTASPRNGESGRLFVSTEYNENKVANRKNVHPYRVLVVRACRVRGRRGPAVRHFHIAACAGPVTCSGTGTSTRPDACTGPFASATGI